jgi:hypothetical protein
MSRILLVALLLISIHVNSTAQRGWAFLKGEASNDYPVSMVKGQPHPNNTPGLRIRANTWTYNGKLYLYGGVAAYTMTYTQLDDMWMYDTTTNNWTWLSGVHIHNQQPVYGTKGVAATANTPGSRENCTTWVLNGKLYLYGGGKDELWRYDPITGQWTWLSGNDNNKYAIFGTQGISASTNSPGALSGAISWVHNNKLYLYGGTGYDSTSNGDLNDIWEYNPATGYWTWIKGSKTAGFNGAWGTKNVPSSNNVPQGVPYNVGWYLNGKFYTFCSYGDYVWEFNHTTNYWTWRKGINWTVPINYGQLGIADTLNTPGSTREGSLTWVHNGKLYLYGGLTYKPNDPNKYFKEDLWELNPNTFNWTWIGGSVAANTVPRYGILGHTNKYNWPGPRDFSFVWPADSSIYVMGAYIANTISDALWKFDYDKKHWTWLKGNHNPKSFEYYIEKYVPDELNEPSIRTNAMIWQFADTIYMHGDDGTNGYWGMAPRNILWRYLIDKNLWTPIEVFDFYGIHFGVKGQYSTKNNPGLRLRGYRWQYDGKLYLFSGDVYGPIVRGRTDDMWEYDIASGNWRWLKGDSSGTTAPVYGIKGTASASNTPGWRYGGISWTVGNKFYLFGGTGYDANGQLGRLNDLWEYDVTTGNWRWLKGSNLRNQFGVYGTKGVASTSNTPGARVLASGCTANGKLYLFGGNSYITPSVSGNSNPSNDLWEYDPITNNWRWLTGNLSLYPNTVFGTKNVPASSNTPGDRQSPAMWSNNGKIFLFGGSGQHTYPTNDIFIDDLWEYNLTTGYWTWIDGSKNYRGNGRYDKERSVDTSYHPGAGISSSTWSYGNRLYLFAGERTLANMYLPSLLFANNALWYYQLCDSPHLCYPNKPVINLDSVSTLCNNKPLVLNAGNVGCTYLWNTNDTTQSIAVSTPGIYWVRVTNPNNLSETDTVIVLSGAAPALTLGKDTIICVPDSIVLNATNPQSKYYWSTGDTSRQITVATEELYSVLVIDTNGCYNNDSIFIDVNPRPVKPKLGNNGPLCSGDTLFIVDSISKQGITSIYGPNGFLVSDVQYWNYGVVMADSGLYYIIDSVNGCTSADTTQVKVDSAFTPVVSLNVSPGTNIWPYVQLDFTANVNYGLADSKFQWHKNGQIIPGETGQTYKAIAYTDLMNGDIICVHITNSNECAITDTSIDCAQPIKLSLSTETVNNSQNIYIYPNPVKDNLLIDGLTDDCVIKVLDLAGKLRVQKLVVDRNSCVIDMERMSPGVYFLHIIQQSSSTVMKISKE